MENCTAIIGGGAAGFMSAIHNAYNGGKPVIIERKDRVLKKVLATGNGRCNFTNIKASPENYFGKDRSFVKHALEAFPPDETIRFFEKIGVMPRIEEDGKVYPFSSQASSVVDALRRHADYLGIDIINNFDVTKISKSGNSFYIYSSDDQKIEAKKVILATGGKASPDLCSDGSGYSLLKKLGHKITDLYPVLVQLKTEKENIRGLQGIKTTAMVYAVNGKKTVGKDYNEILFTEYGISGSAVFNLSYLTALYDSVSFIVDFMPDYDENTVKNILRIRKTNLSYLTMEDFLNGMLNKKIGQAVAKRSGIEKLSFPVSELNDKAINNIASNIKNFNIKILGTTGFRNAQVTAGGALTAEFNEKTMESKKIKGLYAVGELLDIFGECGGYNLQWAWSSGYVAGISSALEGE